MVIRGFLHALAEIQFSTLRDYSELMETSIKEKSEEHVQELNALADKYPEDMKQEFWDYNIDGLHQFYNDYPNLLRSSILVSCITNVEKTFIRLLSDLRENSDLKPVSINNKKLEGSDIEKVVQSIGEIIDLSTTTNSDAWKDLILNIKIRNRVIHSNGVIHPKKYESLFTQIKEYELRNQKFVALNQHHEIIFLEGYSEQIIAISKNVVDGIIVSIQQDQNNKTKK
ncbi:hypothetical protein [Paenibacillus illinoisensis]|uniref:hypothetical protein n=1 Tax=Paenibacillus illinoisensis TaxID=59845 RepID=UPI003D296C78